MEALADHYGKFQQVATPRTAPSAQDRSLKLREEMAEVFVTLKLPLPLTDTLVRKLREVVSKIKDHERRILDLSTRVAKMPRKDFIRAWEGNQTNLGWVDERAQAQAEVVVGPARRQGPDHRRAGSHDRRRERDAR